MDAIPVGAGLGTGYDVGLGPDGVRGTGVVGAPDGCVPPGDGDPGEEGGTSGGGT